MTTELSLDELWKIARQYGRVSLCTSEKGTYWCNIQFDTIKHVVLKAEHDGFKSTPHIALRLAIEKAEEIVSSLNSSLSKEGSLNNIKRLTK